MKCRRWSRFMTRMRDRANETAVTLAGNEANITSGTDENSQRDAAAASGTAPDSHHDAAVALLEMANNFS